MTYHSLLIILYYNELFIIQIYTNYIDLLYFDMKYHSLHSIMDNNEWYFIRIIS